MLFGYCLNMIAQDRARIGSQRIPELVHVYFDYVELPLT